MKDTDKDLSGCACERCGKVPTAHTLDDFHFYSGYDPKMEDEYLCDECAEELWGLSGWTCKQMVYYPEIEEEEE